MRWLLLLVLVSGCALHHNRAYYRGNVFYSETLKLHADSTFSWQYSDCTGWCSVAGTYSCTKKHLVLTPAPDTAAVKPAVIRHEPTTADTCVLHFFIGSEQEALTGVLIYALDSTHRVGAITDFDGNATLRIPATAFPLRFLVKSILFKADTVYLSEPMNVRDSIWLRSIDCSYAMSWPKMFRVRRHTSRKLVLQEKLADTLVLPVQRYRRKRD